MKFSRYYIVLGIIIMLVGLALSILASMIFNAKIMDTWIGIGIVYGFGMGIGLSPAFYDTFKEVDNLKKHKKSDE